MKKFLGLLFLVLLMNGCDDGDATVDTITFDEVDAQSCDLLVYKITENQAMIIKLANLEDFNAAFINDPGVRNREVGVNIDVSFRTYSGTVTGSAICDSPPPIAPIATSEWLATAGTVEITTTAVYEEPNAETGQVKIDKYRHSIVLRNIKFAKPDGTDQSYSAFNFGNFFTEPTYSTPLAFSPENVALCPATNTIYNAINGGTEGLYLKNFDAGLLSTDNLGVPKTALIGQENNRVVYRRFLGALPSDGNENYFCSASTTLTTAPGTAEEWIAVDGDGTNGIIEVTTNTFGGGFMHTIRLKGVTFKKGNSTFYYGNDILYGELIQ